MSLAQEYAEYATICERAMEHVKTSIFDYLAEIESAGERSPISAIETRIKKFDSVKLKCRRKKISCNIANIRSQIADVAGIRIITLFRDDIFRVAEAIKSRLRLQMMTIKDYISDPKDNGYQSLHLLVQREIYFNGETHIVPVEIQIRSKAMDLWASIEHVISYKCEDVDPAITDQFRKIAEFLTAFDKSAIELRDTTSTKNPPS